MQLDTTKYEEYLEIQRGAPGGLGDLFARYAITLPATDADIATQIRTVRTYWREIESRAKFREVARFLLAEDQRLRAEYGAKMDTAAWWQARQVTVTGSQGLLVGDHNSQVNVSISASGERAAGWAVQEGATPAPRTGLKAELPRPYDQDLSAVLSHLDRRTVSGKARVANDPATAAYLAAAVRLIDQHLGPLAERLLGDLEDRSSFEDLLIELLSPFLSQRKVAVEVANNPEPFLRQGSVAAMRSLWMSQSDFIADVLNFVGFYRVFSTSLEPESSFAADHTVSVGSNLPGPDEGVPQVHDLAGRESPLPAKSRSAGLQPLGALDAPGNARRGSRRIGRILRRAGMPIDALTVLRSSQTELQIRALDVIETELDRAYTALGPPLGVGGTPR